MARMRFGKVLTPEEVQELFGGTLVFGLGRSRIVDSGTPEAEDREAPEGGPGRAASEEDQSAEEQS